ncbi:hypothetical protein BCR42DRAFT_396559 [Absidia repens]|uniref:Uncharacterized protein n=1 Tax=Absidia repens TaxID=90262 RepID=A0A1X2I4A7_9FUNG|nr:hypothetical protein BCR42DRAFT_396559 [Absidia repens]
MDIIITRGHKQQVQLEKLQEVQETQQKRLQQIEETVQQQQQQIHEETRQLKELQQQQQVYIEIQKLTETQTTLQQQIQLLEVMQATQQQQYQQIHQSLRQKEQPMETAAPAQPIIPWPTRTKSLQAVRKPRFLAALLYAKNANTVMEKIVASYYHVTHIAPMMTRMTWDALPATLKQSAITDLEHLLRLEGYSLHSAEDHWMAVYLMNEQCIEIRWHQQASGLFYFLKKKKIANYGPAHPTSPDDAFVTAILAAEITPTVTEATLVTGNLSPAIAEASPTSVTADSESSSSYVTAPEGPAYLSFPVPAQEEDDEYQAYGTNETVVETSPVIEEPVAISTSKEPIAPTDNTIFKPLWRSVSIIPDHHSNASSSPSPPPESVTTTQLYQWQALLPSFTAPTPAVIHREPPAAEPMTSNASPHLDKEEDKKGTSKRQLDDDDDDDVDNDGPVIGPMGHLCHDGNWFCLLMKATNNGGIMVPPSPYIKPHNSGQASWWFTSHRK